VALRRSVWMSGFPGYGRRWVVAAVALSLVASLLSVMTSPKPVVAAPARPVCPGSRPDEVSAVAAARLCAGDVLVDGDTTETRQVWAQRDGQLRMQVSAGPVRVRRGGGWVPVDATLVRTSDGGVATVATPGGLTLSGAAGAGEHVLASVGRGGGRTSLLWTGVLPDPVLAGARATYRDVRSDVDLVVDATVGGFEVSLLVKSPAGAGAVQGLVLPIVAPAAVSFTRDAAGNLALTDASGAAFVGVPAMRMWDARSDPHTGAPLRTAAVGAGVARRAAGAGGPGGVSVTLRPDLAWLRDPATVYPVTIDPTINPLSTAFDTYVKQNDTVDRSGAGDLQLGIVSGNVARAFVDWDTSALAYKQVTAATLYFWNFWSDTCSARSWQVWKTGAAGFGTLWTNQPSWTTLEASSTATKGFDATCDDAFVSISGLGLFQDAAASGSSRAHSGLRAGSETDGTYFKQFRSRNYTNTALVPYAVVTYNSIPQIGTRSTVPATTCVAGSGRPYLNSATPQLKTVVTDAEGQASTVNIEWWAVGGATAIGSSTLTNVPSGGTATATVASGAFSETNSYKWRVDASDGTGTSAWSSWCEFTIDTTAPSAAPSVSSTDYPANTWAGAAGTAGTFTFAAGGVTDVASYLYGLDQNPPTTSVPATVLGGGASVSLTPATAGPHTVYLESVDRAGNVSPLASYPFDVGSAALTSPTEGTTTAGLTQLSGSAPSGTTGVTYQWRRADTDTWTSIPTGDVSVAAGGGSVSWPLGQVGGAYPILNWNLKQTLANANTPSNLNGRWPLADGQGTTAADASGLGNPGTATASVAWSGEHGGSAVFNGSSSTTITTAHATVDSSASFTVSAWVYLNDLTGFRKALGPMGSVRNPFDLRYDNSVNRWKFTVSYADVTSTGSDSATSTTAGAANTWVHLVGVQDTTTNTIKLYLNGVLEGTTANTQRFNATGPLLIGAGYTGGVKNNPWYGKVSDVQLYSRVLTATEISALYAGGTTAGGGQALAGPLQVRASFTGGPGGTSTATHLTYDRDTATAATASVGPGAVNLVTGSYTISAADVSVDSYGSDLSVGRSFATRQASGFDATHMFGPGWVTTATVAGANAPYTGLSVVGSLVQVGLPDASTLGFTATGATTFTPEVGSEDLTLTYSSGSDSYTLSDLDGTVVTFTHVSGAAAGQYTPTAVTLPGSGQTTTTAWQTATVDGVSVTRPTQMLAPVPAGVTCTTLVRGCRALTFAYAATTTATGTSQAGWGDYTGRVQSISFTAWDPTTAAMSTVVLSRYLYDSTGRLTAQWDPRLDNGTTHLWTTYAYNSDATLSTITPNTQPAWTLTYTTLPADLGIGRLASVSRSALTAGTATTTVVYSVPVSGSGAPYDMSTTQTARWDEQQAPLQATAVFDPGQIPTGNQANGTLPTSWTRASVSYLDANSRTINTITPGGYTTTTWYDRWGNTVRTLSAGNRAQALNASGTDTAAQEAALAVPVSTRDDYSSDGQELIDSYGPSHTVQLATGTVVQGRAHSHTSYDEGAQSPCPCKLPTTVTDTTAWWDSGGAQHDDDARTSTTGYDWTLRQPTSSTVDPGTSPHLNLTTRTEYDATTGQTTAVTSPAGGVVDTTPSTTQSVYYRAGTGSGYTECDSYPEWANLPCRSQPGGQPATGPELPVTVTTYDMFNKPTVVTEKISTGVLRTTTTTYDSAERVSTVAVTGATGTGTAVPTVRDVYDPATGYLTNVQSLDAANNVTAQTITGYDSLGRVTSYTDTDNTQTTTSYDLLSRTATIADGNDTRTYTYDQNGENRGLPTTIADTLAGTFSTAGYDPDGRLTSETWPDGMIVTHTYNETGTPTGLTYTKPGCGQGTCVLYQDSATPGTHDQTTADTNTLASRTYSYDPAARLTVVKDTQSGNCTTRSYTFNTATDRTGLTSYGPATDGTCQTTTPATSRTWTYDAADRLTTTGYTYDTLARTTTTPAGDTQTSDAGDLTATYHLNDLVRTLTQNGATTTYTLDVDNQRVRSWTDGAGVTHLNHHANTGDSPSWTTEGTGATTEPVNGLAGLAAIVTTGTGAATTWQITNLHGDITATITGTDQVLDATSLTNEYGILTNPTQAATQRYGWLGAKQRPADNPAGIILMGVRLYNPTTGRFLQVDPVPGGSATRYDYTDQDPINRYDVDGRCWNPINHKCWTHHAAAMAWDLGKMAFYTFSLVDGLGELRIGYGAYRFYRAERAAGRAARFRPLGRGRNKWRRLGDAFGIISGYYDFRDDFDDFNYHEGCLRGGCVTKAEEEARNRRLRGEFVWRGHRRPGTVEA
jgi:RHS repeat-associated protein